MALIVWRSMYTGILSLGKNPGENPLSFKVYVCCIFGFQGKNWQRMSKVHLSGSQRCILNWPQVIFPNFKHRTSDLTFSLSRSMFIERSVINIVPYSKVGMVKYYEWEIVLVHRYSMFEWLELCTSYYDTLRLTPYLRCWKSPKIPWNINIPETSLYKKQSL